MAPSPVRAVNGSNPWRPEARILAVVLAAGAFYVVGRLTGATGYLGDVARLRACVQSAGALGVLVFIGLFVGAQIISVPAIVPLGVSVVVFGVVRGTAIGFVAALVGISVVFFMARRVGGQPLTDVGRPWVRRLLTRIDERPVRTVALIRLLLWVFPPVNYALAMSPVRYRDYLLGSALGLALPMAIAGTLISQAFGTP